jgi:hypothetical protein
VLFSGGCVDGERAVDCAFFLPRRRRALRGLSFSCTRFPFKYSFQAFSDLKALAGIRGVAKPPSLVSTVILASRKIPPSFSTRNAQ